MKIFIIGDIFGEPGRQAVKKGLPEVIQEHKVDFVIANCENAAHGRGVTPKIADDFFAQKINVLTSGNHIWDQREIIPYLNQNNRLLRPANYPPGVPGVGYGIFDDYLGIRVGVINLEGNIFLSPKDCPFRKVDAILEEWKGKTDLVVVDMHAEVTSEKRGMGWYLNGRVAAVVGTHTHVQTADEEVLNKGTAYLSDLGMTGPHNSVIGLKTEIAHYKFLKKMPHAFEVAEGDMRLHGAIIEVDERTGRAEKIQRIQKKIS
ncbi:MAG: TIGR00282 family metallophosphoesterase [bacterium]|nr:TIGR00282 family metallophosphoesterase [bacterium]